MLNKVILQGRLVADPELRTTQSGIRNANFRIAVERNYKSKDANAQSADFITVVAWRSTAEFICQYFNKGSMILIDGSIQTRQYTDKNGAKRTAFEVVAENVNFAGSKREESSGGNCTTTHTNASTGAYNAQNGNYGAPNQYMPQMEQIPADEYEELPF